MYWRMMFSGAPAQDAAKQDAEVPVHDVPFTRHEDQVDAERGKQRACHGGTPPGLS
jgi:hypothetical protein